MQYTLHSQLASIQQLDEYSSLWFNIHVNTNNLADSVLLRYGTASQKAFQDQSTTENGGIMFPQITGIQLPTDTTSQPTRTQISATLLQNLKTHQQSCSWHDTVDLNTAKNVMVQGSTVEHN